MTKEIESEFLNKLNSMVRNTRKQFDLLRKEKDELFIKLNDSKSDEKFTICDINNYKNRYNELLYLLCKLEVEFNVWEECREMLFEVIYRKDSKQ